MRTQEITLLLIFNAFCNDFHSHPMRQINDRYHDCIAFLIFSDFFDKSHIQLQGVKRIISYRLERGNSGSKIIQKNLNTLLSQTFQEFFSLRADNCACGFNNLISKILFRNLCFLNLRKDPLRHPPVHQIHP